MMTRAEHKAMLAMSRDEFLTKEAFGWEMAKAKVVGGTVPGRKAVLCNMVNHKCIKFLDSHREEYGFESAHIELTGGIVTMNFSNFPPYKKLLKWLRENEPLRDQEPSLRWRANYDLLRAEMGVLRARLYEFGVTLRKAREEHPKGISGASRIRLAHYPEDETWMGAGSQSLAYANEAKRLLRIVIRNHPDTVWALRAATDLEKGFGVKLTVY